MKLNLILALLLCTLPLYADPEIIELGDDATITVYLPAPDIATGQAVVVCPGGGYGGICTSTEGTPIAKLLLKRGIAGVVLKYRLPNGDPKLPGEDLGRAVRYTREHAEKWNVNPTRIGVWGFSAGGHLAATGGTLARGIEQPDFQVLFYPVISMKEGITHSGSRERLLGETPSEELVEQYSLETQVSKETPPTFMLHAATDGAVPPENSLLYYQALLHHKIPAVLHVYQKGGHGPGAFKQNPSWEPALDDWLKER